MILYFKYGDLYLKVSIVKAIKNSSLDVQLLLKHTHTYIQTDKQAVSQSGLQSQMEQLDLNTRVISECTNDRCVCVFNS